MLEVDLAPARHVFVCANRRAPGSPLGEGCGARGEAVYEALKDEVARRNAIPTVWVTRTQCLGVCPKEGATVAVYPAPPSGRPLIRDVVPTDAAEILGPSRGGTP
jgi:(2Fe-2S) ferredoxin